ncbi:hypothetical protein C7H19_13160 [Aphanothece hegewaldii CCALA 016]|uniref:Uncharacterized protein n=1 Tax=Aphanothece hegewaldii CCALA 016 TaxID=2107694 RepID=A0A2T1LX17_9CHRO|nr:hypothetical protein [Aphanothece hegewaldii]PSF36624.1 hypothetical protein C7H19_13160 [Aphanothece hegewaldii CCALA 016]
MVNPQTPQDLSDIFPDITYDATARPIWEMVVEIGAQIPLEEWEKVPTDLSKNFDQYQNALTETEE